MRGFGGAPLTTEYYPYFVENRGGNAVLELDPIEGECALARSERFH